MPSHDFDADALCKKAVNALANAYCPYSKFPVGAALLADDGQVFTGVNVENASYGGTICAERSAIVSAVSAGVRKFKAIAVATQLEEPGSPCGICRQVLVEFGDYAVILCSAKSNKRVETTTFGLLPMAFVPEHLQGYQKKLDVNGASKN
ncbi:CDD-1 protein [Aphelenchoides avenae]|nr:CDD-1 protein [Aphelenchus avenae]